MATPHRIAGLLLLGATSLAALAPAAAAAPAISRPPASRLPARPAVKPAPNPTLPPGMVIDPPAGTSFSSVGGDSLGQAGVIAAPASGAPAPPDVPVGAYVIADVDTGKILAARNPHWKLRPASTLKMLTAVTLLPKLNDVTFRYVGEQEDPEIAEGGSAVGIAPGVTYSLGDLWRGVFLRSGNDAIGVLAKLSGGTPRTIEAMRGVAHDLHADDTTVVDADGYDADGQFSSAYDLALIARAGLRMPAFREYCSTQRSQFPGKDGKSYEIDNENRLLGVYPGMIGVKNGYTSGAHWTFVGAASRNGHTLVVSVMDAASRQIYPYTRQLLDWGFAAEGGAAPVGELVAPGGPANASQTGADLASQAGARSAVGQADAGSDIGWLGWTAFGVGVPVLAVVLLRLRAIRRRRGRIAMPASPRRPPDQQAARARPAARPPTAPAAARDDPGDQAPR